MWINAADTVEILWISPVFDLKLSTKAVFGVEKPA